MVCENGEEVSEDRAKIPDAAIPPRICPQERSYRPVQAYERSPSRYHKEAMWRRVAAVTEGGVLLLVLLVLASSKSVLITSLLSSESSWFLRVEGRLTQTCQDGSQLPESALQTSARRTRRAQISSIL
eukprot:557906-Hanusia_phi.AAC.2